MREELVALLRRCGVLTLLELGLEDAVRSGTADIAVGDLAMDSLAAMEFCIAVEERWGVSITPARLREEGTLGALSNRLATSSATDPERVTPP